MRGEARVNDRRVLKANLGFCVQVRRGAIRAEHFGSYTTC